MTSAKLIQLSGIVSIVNGILLLGFGILPSLLLPTKEPLLAWVMDDQWFVLNIFAFLLTLLTPLALLGFYAKQIEQVGKMGLVGLIMSYLGGMLYVGVQFDETFTWPVIATHAPDLVSVEGALFTDPAFSMAYLLMALLFIPGIVLLCISIVKAGILPKWGAILLAVGSPMVFGGMMVPQIIRGLGAILGAIGFVWLGQAIYRDEDQ